VTTVLFSLLSSVLSWAPNWLRRRVARVTGLAHHEVMGLLGVGDLHPGGRAATLLLLKELESCESRRILELGAGIGLTTASLLERGWQVTPVEPSPILRKILARRLAVDRVFVSMDELDVAAASFDAVIGEGVLYALDLPDVLPKLRRLIRPGGLLALTDVALAEGADADLVASVHQRTKAIFGFPMVPEDVLTWRRWNDLLGGAGFSPVFAQRVRLDDRPLEGRRDRLFRALAIAARPGLALPYLKFRVHRRREWMPAGSIEGWAATFRRNADTRGVAG
jgi:SAM-dependent methyltransferase